MRSFNTLFFYLPFGILGTLANVIPSKDPSNQLTKTPVPETDLELFLPTFDAVCSTPAKIEVAGFHLLDAPDHDFQRFNNPYRTKPRFEEREESKIAQSHVQPRFTNGVKSGTNTRQQKPRNPTLPEPTPPPSPALKDNPMCVFLGAALGICDSLTPGFTTMRPSMQAQCLCYSSAVWSPNVFDDAVDRCAAYASTAAPLAYDPLADLGGFCSSIGDVKAPKSTAAITTTATDSPVPTGANSDCYMVLNAFVSCTEKDAAFNGLDAVEQAKCLCYDGTPSWIPTQLDNAVRKCVEGPAYPASLPSASMLVGLCANVGNALGSSALAPSTTPVLASTVVLTSLMPPISELQSTEVSSSVVSTLLRSNPPSNIASSLSENNPSTTTSSTYVTTTSAELPTKVRNSPIPTPTPTNKAPRREVERWEVIWVSFCCAMVLLFLCWEAFWVDLFSGG